MLGYGDPEPWDGMSSEPGLLPAVYVGTSFRIRSFGNAPPSFVVRVAGEALRLISERFERVEDDR